MSSLCQQPVVVLAVEAVPALTAFTRGGEAGLQAPQPADNFRGDDQDALDTYLALWQLGHSQQSPRLGWTISNFQSKCSC